MANVDDWRWKKLCTCPSLERFLPYRLAVIVACCGREARGTTKTVPGVFGSREDLLEAAEVSVKTFETNVFQTLLGADLSGGFVHRSRPCPRG